MDDMPIVAGSDVDQLFNRVLGRYDVPAYIRRAQQVQDAFDQLVARCRQQRDEWLTLTRIRLGQLHGLAGSWERLRPLLAGEGQIQLLRQLYAALAPRLRLPVRRSNSRRVLRRALVELCDSIERFNKRWQVFLAAVDLTPVNAVRDGYNRYYLVEKECAVRSARLARQGFLPLPPVRQEEIEALLPVLPVPQLA